jgi:hypothetical protein
LNNAQANLQLKIKQRHSTKNNSYLQTPISAISKRDCPSRAQSGLNDPSPTISAPPISLIVREQDSNLDDVLEKIEDENESESLTSYGSEDLAHMSYD